MPIIGVLTVYLTGLGTQQVLQGPKDKLNPGAPSPPPAPDEVVPFDLLSIGQGKNIGLFTLNKQSALMRIANMLHKLRVAEPTVGNYDGRRQLHATPTKRCHAFVKHHPGPAQLFPA